MGTVPVRIEERNLMAIREMFPDLSLNKALEAMLDQYKPVSVVIDEFLSDISKYVNETQFNYLRSFLLQFERYVEYNWQDGLFIKIMSNLLEEVWKSKAEEKSSSNQDSNQEDPHVFISTSATSVSSFKPRAEQKEETGPVRAMTGPPLPSLAPEPGKRKR